MLYYTWAFIIFNLVWSHVDRKESTNEDGGFAGVLQNITRVNKVLQDLIHNYKELQTFYNTEETFDKGLSDAENVKIKEKDANISEHVEDVPARVTNRNFPVTNIGLNYFNSGEDNNNNVRTPKLKHVEKTKKNNVTPQVLAFQLNGNVKDVYIDAKSGKSGSVERMTSNEEKDNSKEIKVKTGNLNYNKGDKNIKAKRDDTLKVEHDKQASSEFESNDDGEVLRSLTRKPIQNGKSYTKDKIWVKIPKELKNSTESNNFEMYEEKSEQVDKIESINEDDEESDLEIALNNDLQQTNILRAAYGDACLRLVLKKCHKACKEAIKDACSDSGCKSRLKRTLKKAAKSKCLQQFVTKGTKNNNETMRLNPSLTNDDGEKGFTDMTRQGYLATYCMTETEKAAQMEESIDKSVFRNETPSISITDSPYDAEMNILRDRYERACIKVSRKKCITACKCIFKDTCTEHTCNKALKKVSKKSCKRKCTNWFKESKKKSMKKKDKDDSDSDDESDESEDDSD